MMMRKGKFRRGGAAVEVALLMPVVVVLMLGCIDWAWYLVDFQMVISAAQAGARTGAQTDPTVDDPAQAAATEAQVVLEASYPGVLPTGVSYTGTILNGDTVSIQVVVPYDALIGIAPMPPSIQSTALMRIEAI